HDNVAVRRRNGVALAGGDQQPGKVVARPDDGNVGNWRQRDRHRCRAHLSATSTVATNPAWPVVRAAIYASYPEFPPGRDGLRTWDEVIAAACAFLRTARPHALRAREQHQRMGAKEGGATGLRARTTL